MNTFTKVILVFLLFIGKVSFAQTTPLTYSVIPTSATDLNRPGGGAEQWTAGQNVVNIPTQGINTQRLDAFYRFIWYQVQPQSATGPGLNMNFSLFDAQVQDAINKGQKFGFGIMNNYFEDISQVPQVGGGGYSYPLALHNAMQAESTKDLLVGNQWYENTNSLSLRTWFKAREVAISNHIATTTFMGVPYSSMVTRVDARIMGDFGENIVLPPKASLMAVNGVPTSASIDSLLDVFRQAYSNLPNIYVVNMIGVFSGGYPGPSGVGVTPVDAGAFALQLTKNGRPYGWRRDNWGQTDNYIRGLTDLNTNTFGGFHFDTAIMNRFKYAPVCGEPQDGGSETNFSDFVTEVQRYGAQSFGNGNFNNGVNATIQNNFRAASKAAGYRFVLNPNGSITGSQAGGPFQIVQHWRNVGAAPTYENWNCVYDLRTGPTAAPVWSGTSSFTPKLFLPAGSDNVVTDNFTLTSVPAGTYELHMTMKDPLGYRFPMPIYITNTQQADGSYIILTNIVIGTGGPVANAGPNQSIIISSASLSGSSSTGTISSYLWTQISGPNTATITTPTTVGTTVTGLITGTYIFQLAINGGSSGALIDQVQIIVNAPVLQANAGNNQTITLPTSTVSLSGSGSTGVITSYLWSQVSGPNVPTITTPTTVGTTVTGLIAGTYVFDLSINGGASHSQVTIKVLPAPLPIANAGVSQTIALPTSSVSVSGSNSTGNITSYAWSMLSGPNTAVFSSAATVNTNITGLIEGIYLIQLSLNGGSAIDTMRVYVNPAAPPIPTGQTIFTTQVPAGGTLKDVEGGGLVGIELGTKFRVSVNGFILGIRFYKTTGNTGAHTAQLYDKATGTLLGSATFINESLTGWQTAVFATPIAVTAGTTYIASYFSPSGFYTATNNYFATSVVNAQMTALADGTDGNNGVYKYTNTPATPINTFQKSNYWVDALFSSPNTNPCNCHPRNKFTTQRILNGF